MSVKENHINNENDSHVVYMRIEKLSMKYFLVFIVFMFGAIYSSTAQWVPVNGPRSEFVSEIIEYDGAQIIGCWSGVCFFDSLNSKWDPKNVGIEQFSPPYYEVGSVFQNISGIYVSNYYGQIYKSVDNGEHWAYLYTVSMEQYDGAINIYGNDQVVIICSNNSVKYSHDNGLTWLTGLVLTNDELIYSISSSNSDFYIGTNHGNIYKSVDNAANWTTLDGFTLPWTKVFLAATNNNIYAVTNESNVYKSEDNGATWSEINSGLYQSETKSICCSGDSICIGTLSDGIFLSQDSGLSWTQINNGLTARHVSSVLISSSGIYATTYYGVFFKAHEANNWMDINDGLQRSTTNDFIIRDSIIYALHESFIMSKSDNLGENWEQINGTIPYDSADYLGDILDFAEAGTKLFRIHNRKGLFYSEDSGLTWVLMSNGIPCVGLTQVASQGQVLFVSTDSCGVYKSYDYGETWNYTGNGLPILGYYPRLIATTDTKVYISYYCFSNSETDITFVSDDAGESWSESDEDIYWDFYNQDSVIIIAAEEAVILSIDNGTTWSLLDEGLPISDSHPDIFCVASDGMNHFIGTQMTGVYYFQDNHWIPITGGLNSLSYGDHVYNLEIDNGFLYASIDRNGIWKRSIEDPYINNCSGKVFLDINQDSVYNSGDVLIENAIVNAVGSGVYESSNPVGVFNITTNLCSDTLRSYISCDYAEYFPDHYIIEVSDTSYDFAVSLKENVKDLRIDLNNLTFPRPGFDYDLKISYTNVGTVTMDGYVDFLYDNSLVYSSANPSINSVSSDSLRWYFSELEPFETRFIYISFFIPTIVESGDELICSAYAKPIVGDSTKYNNFFALSKIVSSSFDPNLKSVVPDSASISPYFIANQQDFIYTIQFQNTGNDTAFNVSILDTLSPNLFIPSFRVLSASHNYDYSISGPGIVEFSFQDIMLPDSSSNEPLSHGFIKYSVKPLRSLVIGDEICNTAHIYFDFNEAVVTNTTSNIVSIIQQFNSEKTGFSYSLYPNPVTGILNIETDYLGMKNIRIVDSQGRIVKTKNMHTTSLQLDCNDLLPGLYFVLIGDESDNIKFKFVKQ